MDQEILSGMSDRLAALETQMGQIQGALGSDQLKAMIVEAVQDTLAPVEMGQVSDAHHLCNDESCQPCREAVSHLAEVTRQQTLQEVAQVPGVMAALQLNSQGPISQLRDQGGS